MAQSVFCSTASSCILNISDSEMLAKCDFTLPILFCLDHTLLIPGGVNNAQLLRHTEPIRSLETPRSLSEYIPIRHSLFFLYANVLLSQYEPLSGLQRDVLFVECF